MAIKPKMILFAAFLLLSLVVCQEEGRDNKLEAETETDDDNGAADYKIAICNVDPRESFLPPVTSDHEEENEKLNEEQRQKLEEAEKQAIENQRAEVVATDDKADVSPKDIPIIIPIPIQKLCFSKRKGMTWGQVGHQAALGVDFIGCTGLPGPGCNWATGDTLCTQKRPILCLNKSAKIFRPDYSAPGGNYFTFGWTGGDIKLTRYYQGCAIKSRAHGDSLCQREFGCNYYMAEYHDGYYISGMGLGTFYDIGWNWSLATPASHGFAAFGESCFQNPLKVCSRYWVAHDHGTGSTANCWN